MRRVVVVVACLAVVAGSPLIAGVAHADFQSGRDHVTVNIQGTETFKPNGISSTYHFPDAPIKVHPGGFVTFNNQTNDGHTITLVAASDVPTSFNCMICDAVNATYFPDNSGNPAGVQIDNGVAGDDEATDDADTQDPAVPPGVTPPFPVLIEDFDTPGHTNADTPPTVGDSTLVDANGSNNTGFVTQRTIQVSNVAGTYDFICTFHPWMHGQIVVG